MNHVLGIADRQQGEFLGTRVGHIRGYRQKLLEEEKRAERDALWLTPKGKISRQCEWRKQLEKRSTGDHDEFSTKAKKKMAALMDGHKNPVHQTRQYPVARLLKKEKQIKRDPCD
jgi:hypothetical protein